MTDPWEYDAACAEIGTDMWFPGADDRYTANKATNICNTACTVREQCLNLALTEDIRDGIWGGVDAWGRRQIRLAANREKAA